MSAPPLAPLREVVERLEGAGIACALGGSGLLMALGLVEQVHDWDLTTDASPAAVLAALAGRDLVLHGNSGDHADHKVVTAGGAIEVIARFAFRVPGGVARIPTIVSGRWRGVPLGSAEAWAAAYVLLGRPAKAELLFAHLARRGAEPSALRTLLAQPLPRALAARLRALERSAGAGAAPQRLARARSRSARGPAGR